MSITIDDNQLVPVIDEDADEEELEGKSLTTARTKQIDDFARAWIANRSLTLAKSINSTLLAAVSQQLKEGFEQGESIQQLTKRISGYYESNQKWMAERLSRTEVIAASNEGALHRYELEGVQQKEWFSAPDARPTHLEANGQIVGIKDNFKVGADSMQGPGQGSIPEENINCRCTVLPVV